MRSRILNWPQSAKRLVVIALDIWLALLATWVAFTLRFDTPNIPQGNQWIMYLLAPALALPVFLRFGLYRAIFRYTGLAALGATAKAVAVYALLLFAAVLVLQARGFDNLPRTVAVMQPIFFGVLVGASRALAGLLLSGRRRAAQRLLIYGAGSTGVQTAAGMASTREFVLLGFIDDDPKKVGRSLNHSRVFAPAELPSLVDRLGVTDILLAIPSATRQRRKEIIASLSALPVHIRTIPGLEDLASGRVTVRDFRELDIEDLLGREPIEPDQELLARNCAGKVVLVTGAGGSIGSELCRQILRQRPRQLLLLDHSEFGLYTVHEELAGFAKKQGLDAQIVPLLGNVGNYARIAQICSTWLPNTIYHAAAYKHVPIVEHNPAEGVANNIFGTLNVARAALEAGASRCVLISTDKAVRPTNVMGATKRVAELVFQALAESESVSFPPFGAGRAPAGALANLSTRFVMVRFGNVLGSSGSVVPLFRKQLEVGGPLTVTHPDVTRYFMTIAEAVQLVLQAGAMAEGGEVFVLDMGEPVKIIELARRMIALSGLAIREADADEGDIEIAITGLRPGEKLYEELLIGENPMPTAHPRIMRAREDFLPWGILSEQLADLDQASRSNDVSEMKRILGELVLGSNLAEANFDHLSVAQVRSLTQVRQVPVRTR
jgi:FlaA1/EpsC-like NDP-sugar epimerase